MDHLGELEAVEAAVAYNRYARHYDSLLSENRINAYMRKSMMHLQRLTFQPGERLLELGCGTGDEALALADHGCEVLGIDPSAEMIGIAQEKASSHRSGGRVSFHVGHARELRRVLASESENAFDGAYSSFALSYEKDLGEVRQTLARLLRPGATLLVASMNRLSAVEWVMAMASLHPQLAGRRLRPWTVHKVGTVQTRLYCRTPFELRRAFQPGFRVEKSRALPALLPPHYANRVLRRWPGLLDTIEKVDSRVASFALFRSIGDHNVIWMRRTS